MKKRKIYLYKGKKFELVEVKRTCLDCAFNSKCFPSPADDVILDSGEIANEICSIAPNWDKAFREVKD